MSKKRARKPHFPDTSGTVEDVSELANLELELLLAELDSPQIAQYRRSIAVSGKLQSTGTSISSPTYVKVEDLVAFLAHRSRSLAILQQACEIRVLSCPDDELDAEMDSYLTAKKQFGDSLRQLSIVLAYDILITRTLPMNRSDAAKAQARSYLTERAQILKKTKIELDRSQTPSGEVEAQMLAATDAFQVATEKMLEARDAWPGRVNFAIVKQPVSRQKR